MEKFYKLIKGNEQLRTADLIISLLLIDIILFTKYHYLFFAAFLLLMTKGLAMFLNSSSVFHSKELKILERKEWFQVMLIQLALLLLPALYVVLISFLFSSRKDIWSVYILRY